MEGGLIIEYAGGDRREKREERREKENEGDVHRRLPGNNLKQGAKKGSRRRANNLCVAKIERDICKYCPRVECAYWTVTPKWCTVPLSTSTRGEEHTLGSFELCDR